MHSCRVRQHSVSEKPTTALCCFESNPEIHFYDLWFRFENRVSSHTRTHTRAHKPTPLTHKEVVGAEAVAASRTHAAAAQERKLELLSQTTAASAAAISTVCFSI